jgi:hypothetical protein
MLLQSLFSSVTVAVIAVAPIVSAITVPVPSCSASMGSLTCCEGSLNFFALTTDQQKALAALDHNLNTDLSVGVNCSPPVNAGLFEAWYCTPHISCSIRWLTRRSIGINQGSFCCDSIQNQGASFFLKAMGICRPFDNQMGFPTSPLTASKRDGLLNQNSSFEKSDLGTKA